MEATQHQGTEDVGWCSGAGSVTSGSHNSRAGGSDRSSSQTDRQGSGSSASSSGNSWDDPSAKRMLKRALAGKRVPDNKEVMDFIRKYGVDVNKETWLSWAASFCRPPTGSSPATDALVRLMPVWDNSNTPSTWDGTPYPLNVDMDAVAACMAAGAQLTDSTPGDLSVLQAAVRLGDHHLFKGLFMHSDKLTSDSKAHWYWVLIEAIVRSKGLTVATFSPRAALLWSVGCAFIPDYAVGVPVEECVCGSLEIVQALLRMGTSPNSRTGDQRTLLHHLSNPLMLKGHGTPEERVAVGRALLAEGAQLESRDARGDTPLLTAMYLREWGVVAWLLGAGADTSCTDSRGNSVWDMAVRATDSADYTGLELLLAQGLTPVGGIKQLAQRIVTRSENDLREAYGSVALPTLQKVEKRLQLMRKRSELERRGAAAHARQPLELGTAATATAQVHDHHHHHHQQQQVAAARAAVAAQLVAAEEAARAAVAEKAAKKAAKKQRQAAAKKQAAAAEAAAREQEAAAAAAAAAEVDPTAAAALTDQHLAARGRDARAAAAPAATTVSDVTTATSGESAWLPAGQDLQAQGTASSSGTGDTPQVSEQQPASGATTRNQTQSGPAHAVAAAVEDGVVVTAEAVSPAPVAVPAAVPAVAATPSVSPVSASTPPHSQLPGAMGLLISRLALRETPAATTSSGLAGNSSAITSSNSSSNQAAPCRSHLVHQVPAAAAGAASGGCGARQAIQPVPGGSSGSSGSPVSSERPKRATTRHKECIVCFERKPCVVLLPCQHLLLCGPCWEAVAAAKGPDALQCPYCRSAVQQHMMVFR